MFRRLIISTFPCLTGSEEFVFVDVAVVRRRGRRRILCGQEPQGSGLSGSNPPSAVPS